MVIYPSIRSIFDQKLLYGLTPKISASPTTKVNTKMVRDIVELRSRYCLFVIISPIHKAAANSVKILNAKFLPVMYGNGIEGEIKRGKRGIRNIRILIPQTLIISILLTYDIKSMRRDYSLLIMGIK